MACCPKCCCNSKFFLALTILFLGLLGVCIALVVKIFPDLVTSQINSNVELEKGTEQYDRFMKLPFPLDFKVYIFNITNLDRVLTGDKPIVDEVGPYFYKQYREKTINHTDKGEDTITYTQTQTFSFDQSLSITPEGVGLFEEDEVYVVNSPMLSMLQAAEDMGVSKSLGSCVKSAYPEGYNTLFIKVQVKHLLFGGFNFCKSKGSGLCPILNTVACGIAATKRNIDTLEDGSLQFSFFNYKARAPDGMYEVKRGIDKVEKLGFITNWNGAEYTDVWQGKETKDVNSTCNKVRGWDSTLYPPHAKKSSYYDIFTTDLCRVIQIHYIGDDSYKGVDGRKYGTLPTTLYSSTDNPAEDCFCTNQTSHTTGKKSCFLDGIVDLQPCIGVPVLLSFPHFLWSDQKYIDGVENMKPDEEKHKTYVLLQPDTGTPIQGAKRIQLNAVIRPIKGVPEYDLLRPTVLPMLWVDEGLALTDKYIDQLYDEYFDKKHLLDIVQWVLLGLAAAITAVFGIIFIKKQFYSSKD